MRAARIVATAAVGVAVLAGCSAGTRSVTRVDVDYAHFGDPQQLVDASEYLVKATLLSEPEAYPIPGASYLRYWVGDARITEVVGQRPDAPTMLRPGMTVAVATELLNLSPTGTVAEGVEEFPTEQDLPSAGDRIVAFLVHDRDLAGYGAGYVAVGQGVVDPDGTVTMRAIPGPLNHMRIALTTLTTQAWETGGRQPTPGMSTAPSFSTSN